MALHDVSSLDNSAKQIRIGPFIIAAATFWRGLALAAALLWLYSNTLWGLGNDWWIDENYSHGFLVPFISGYAMYQDRFRLQKTIGRPWVWVGGALTLMAVLMLMAGTLGAEMFVSRVSFVLALVGITLYFGGLEWLKLMLFPIGIFILAIPIPEIIFNQIAFPLQLLASDYAARVINMLGIPALREGNVIELAQMKLQVVEACSGIRSLMSLATLAVTYAAFAESQWWRRIILVASVIPIAIVTNAARVAGTGVMAYYRGPEAAEGFQHAFSGWIIFIVALVLLMAVAQLLRLFSRFLPFKYR
ncbi:MAG TPA: exosortase [Blastocatellia bacterium]|nr:exosortase [Blastocatellia bacterium]